MNKQSNNHNLSFLAPVLLFLILTICILLVLLYGADIYKGINNRDDTTFQKRTITQFLTTKIRQNDVSDAVFAGSFDSNKALTAGDTLFLYEEWNGRTLCTRIYCHDGYLRELFSEADASLNPNAGQKILEASAIHFTQEDNTLIVDIEYEDATQENLIFSLRSKGGQ